MNIFKKIYGALTSWERLIFVAGAAILIFSSVTRFAFALQAGSEWTPVRGGAFREGVVGQPIVVNPVISENPADQDISRLLYSSLTDLTETLESADNGRLYTVKLKEGLFWANGQPLTSDDVLFTIETIQDPDSRSPLIKSWQGVVAERVSELRFNLHLPVPYAFLKNNLERLLVIPAHIFGSIPKSNLRLSVYNLEPVGSGPYRFEGFTKRKDGFISEYRLVINERYHGEKPFIEDFYFVFYERGEELLKDFRLRKIDGFGSLTPLSQEDFPEKNIVINQIPMPNYYALFFNPNVNPTLKEAGVRAALHAAINKRGIIEVAVLNQAELITGPLGRFGRPAAETGEIYNPEAAREKLAPFKKDRLEFTLIIPAVEFLEKAAAMIREDWLAIGVDGVNIIALSPTELLENVIKTSNYEMLLFGNVLPEALDLFPFWHSSQRFYPGLNLALYKNSKADNLIEKVRQTEDPVEQRALALEAEAEIRKDEPAVFLFSLPYTYIHRENLGGFDYRNGVDEFISAFSERFRNVNEWYIAKARVIK